MKVAVASNHVGFKAKSGILSQIKLLNHEGIDFGPSNDEICDYPDYAAKVARAVLNGETDRGILIGGTGIGMSIVANKFHGIRAALCHDDLCAELSRRHNDANIMCLSVVLLGEDLASRMVEVWLDTLFEGGRYARRIAKIAEIEQAIRDGSSTFKKSNGQIE